MITLPTIKADASKPPSWVKKAGKETIWAWENSLSWRADAAQAMTKQYRRFLVKQASDAYHN
jgi:hypothetical protein